MFTKEEKSGLQSGLQSQWAANHDQPTGPQVISSMRVLMTEDANTAISSSFLLDDNSRERDEEALKYLKDIKWCRMDDPKGFKLEFFFDTNPFFTNSILTKVYDYSLLPIINKLIFEKAIGATIEWLPGKCLTQKIFRNETWFRKQNFERNFESFFNFFSPLEYVGSAWGELKHVRQAIGFLVLSVQQLYRICTLYWDDKHNTKSVSPEVISSMRVLMTEDANTAVSSSFLLDDSSRWVSWPKVLMSFTTVENYEKYGTVENNRNDGNHYFFSIAIFLSKIPYFEERGKRITQEIY
ncbi:hypothetical protein CTI12_AA417310 [Artemisia annua]|uniref:Uncharacterized protein n=1 Tax=Artemisia annua TaxID=35608 RepID=A0A2U1M514_ARTAN|nr:hypothetical protein CTI12_AA417310 [Artemisia annua]